MDNFNNSNQWNQQQYNNGMQYNMNMQQPYSTNMQQQYYNINTVQNSSKALAIVALILSIMSVTVCCCAGWIPGLVGLILGIIVLATKRNGQGIAIVSIVISIIGIILGIIIGITGIVQDVTDRAIVGFDSTTSEHFWGSRYKCSDDSVIEFTKSHEFVWKLSEEDSNNVKSGTYKIYFGDDAIDFLVDEHPEYGITEDELNDFFERNSDSDFYTKENLTILQLDNTYVKIDGEVQDVEYTTVYYGYSNEEGFDAANAQTYNYVTFYYYPYE